jgi:CubicO group peptidase (beta-lactamase class C family)
MTWPASLAASLSLAALAACQASPPTPAPCPSPVADDGQAYVPDASWRRAGAAALGLDPARMAALPADISAGRYGSLHAVVVVRYGYVALEHYAGWSAGQPHTLQSVSKSVTSLLYGIVARGQPADGLDRPVLDVFARYQGLQNVDARKQALTVRHLLSMRDGLDFWEQPYAGSPLEQLNQSREDWVRLVLDRPMARDPGTAWAYDSGAAILMGAAVRELSGTPTDELARRELFAPLGVTGETWFRSPYDGLPHCGGGLSLRPLDLARVGYLVLRRGRWGDRQVVPAAWIDASTRPLTHPVPGFFAGANPSYGYFWWLFPTTRGGSDAGVITGSGSGGQWLFVVPSLDLVVAVAAQNGDGLGLLYDGVLPAVTTAPCGRP